MVLTYLELAAKPSIDLEFREREREEQSSNLENERERESSCERGYQEDR